MKQVAFLFLLACTCACQKPYEKVIEDSMKDEPHHCISIGKPFSDEIDSTMWMPKLHVAFGNIKYKGRVQVVEHKYFLGEKKDTITEQWIFDNNLKRVITIIR